MNNFLNAMKNETNFSYTENGAIQRNTTGSAVYDMFALGAAYRSRSDADVINLFMKAVNEDETLALKCLFYIRDAMEGQGERRFFRVCMKWLAATHTEAARRNMRHIPTYGRWDDLYVFVNTSLEKEMFAFMREQLALDVQSKTPSLLAKWLKSENTSSAVSRELGRKTRNAFGMTAKQYRKTLSILRERINVLERLMSARQWDKIEFDKIPSRAGFIYRNAFAKHDVERMMQDKSIQSYADFAKDETKTVNAGVLYPYECVEKAFYHCYYNNNISDTERAIINKYWDNLKDYIQDANFNGIVVADTSGSMMGTPMNVAISLAMYCATKNSGPFANHFFTFESNPHFMEVEGFDFVDKVKRISRAPWGGSTNIEAVFDMMLGIAIRNNIKQEDLPKNVIIVSDMQFDSCVTSNSYNRGGYFGRYSSNDKSTLMETVETKWAAHGYEMPALIFWNVNARNDGIPMKNEDGITFMSGFSPVLFQQLMAGKTAMELMLDKLNSERYTIIR